MGTPAVWPLDIVLHQASGQLQLLWNDGLCARLAAPTLRAACRCSQCESQRRAGNPPVAVSDLALRSLNTIGDIGLQLCFADGHDRGIYPWPYLHELSAASTLPATS
ncbi:MAG: gamma-butyrobetaine hydroxylase-like domain-containing protein [Ramlibacter sp.]